MSENFPKTTIDSEAPVRTPEHQAMIDKFKALADLGATWVEKNGVPVNTVELEDGSKVEMSDGVSFHDIKDFISDSNPDQPDEQTSVEAARLFNRIAIETYGVTPPEDLSRLDTTSETARVAPMGVIRYAVSHLKERLEVGEESELHETINDTAAKYMKALGYEGEQVQEAQAQLYEDIRNRHPSSEYPTLPEY